MIRRRKQQSHGALARVEYETSASSGFRDSSDSCCPICIEPFNDLERRLIPCPCNYRLCTWCLHQIRQYGDNKCPICRDLYSEHKFQTDYAPSFSSTPRITNEPPPRPRQRHKKHIVSAAPIVHVTQCKTQLERQPPPTNARVPPPIPRLQRFAGGLSVWD